MVLKPTTWRIDQDLLDGLIAVKERDGIPVSEQVRRAIVAWLADRKVPLKKTAIRRTRRS